MTKGGHWVVRCDLSAPQGWEGLDRDRPGPQPHTYGVFPVVADGVVRLPRPDTRWLVGSRRSVSRNRGGAALVLATTCIPKAANSANKRQSRPVTRDAEMNFDPCAINADTPASPSGDDLVRRGSPEIVTVRIEKSTYSARRLAVRRLETDPTGLRKSPARGTGRLLLSRSAPGAVTAVSCSNGEAQIRPPAGLTDGNLFDRADRR